MPSSPQPPSPAEIAALATKYGDGAAGLDPASEAGMLAAIAEMKAPGGFDVVIVCCSNQSAENFWQARLEQTVQQVTGTAGAAVLAVHEDWNGGAGNGLGTLYAFQKACAKARATGGMDLAQRMRDGASVALYHTAGKGTRLAPLPGAENNNKPGVKLPGLLTVGGEKKPFTVLESVIRQTSAYAKVRGGRCSVFWGDQIFVPSVALSGGDHPADILAALRPMPSKEEWEAGALHQYGLIAVDPRGDAMQLEKVTYDVAKAYLPADVTAVGTSLGSFSVSAALMDALTDEFAAELKAKEACLDSDPHFWMPLTLKRSDYLQVMEKKGTDAAESGAHFDRMAAFRKKLLPAGGAVLGCVDIGSSAYWWDYGRLELYMDNNLLLTEQSASAAALRAFLELEPPQQASSVGATTVAPTALVVNCKIGKGKVDGRSVLVNVSAPSVDVEGAILMNVTSKRPIVSKGGLLYNVVDAESAGELRCDAVRADVFMEGKQHVINSALSIDGGKAWKQQLDGNPMSFEGVYKANQKLDVSTCNEEAAAAHRAARA